MKKHLENKSKKINKETIRMLLITALVFCVFLTVTGVSWSWFKPLMGNQQVENVTVETANLSIVYNSGPQFTANNILPGWSSTKTFTVTNNGEREAAYNIVWQNITNTFNTKADIVYSITSTNSGGTLSETPFPDTGTNQTIISNVTIPANTTQTYTINMRYINRTTEQSDQGSRLAGKIIINEEAITPSNYVYVVSSTTMNIGSTIPSGVNIRTTPAQAMSDWAAITGVTNDTRPFYLKHNLNGSNEITESYVEFVVTPEMAAANAGMQAGTYTLKGGDGGASFVDNAKKIYDAFGGNGCYLDGNSGGNPYNTTPTSSFYCDVSGLGADADSYGYVDALDNDYYSCYVYDDGFSICG